MPPPTPIPCSVPDCDWVTPATCPTWELLRDMLQIHTSSAHGTPAAGQPGQVRPKPAPVARPEIDIGATEHDWRFFKAEFDRYKRSTGIKDQTILDELWHCQSKPLRSLMQAEASVDSLDTEAKLLEKIKSLAVVTLHSAVHLVELRNLVKGQHEPIRKFVARARNIANSCNLSKKCGSCSHDVSFLDETVFGVVLAGLNDPNIQQKILSLAAMKTIKTLEELITYVAAEESGYKDSANIGQSASTVGGVRSTYMKEKDGRSKCMNCGGLKHGNGGPEDRAKFCPAYGKTCAKCGRKNHLTRVCQSKSKIAAVKDQHPTPNTDPDDPSNASMNFFGIKVTANIHRPPSHPWETGNGVSQTSGGREQEPVCDLQQLAAVISEISRPTGRKQNMVKLPHSVHSLAEGWLVSKPENSPIH